jgi:hypothetical protein
MVAPAVESDIVTEPTTITDPELGEITGVATCVGGGCELPPPPPPQPDRRAASPSEAQISPFAAAARCDLRLDDIFSDLRSGLPGPTSFFNMPRFTTRVDPDLHVNCTEPTKLAEETLAG